jgi:hypothetical protein
MRLPAFTDGRGSRFSCLAQIVIPSNRALQAHLLTAPAALI